jgi:hypothetical protein
MAHKRAKEARYAPIQRPQQGEGGALWPTKGRRRRAVRLPTGCNSPQECSLIFRRSVCLGVSLKAPLRARHASSSHRTKVSSQIKSRRVHKDAGISRKKTADKLGRVVASNMQPMPLTSWPAGGCASLCQVPAAEYQFSTHKFAMRSQR